MKSAHPSGGRFAAARADLVYVSDTDPGLHRRRAGKGFCYFKPGGGRVTSRKTLARIKALAVPPAWSDVWICMRQDGHIQATGRDERGRKQYRYHAAWLEARDEAKFSSLAEFAEALPKLRQQVDKALRLRGLPHERVIASVVWLLDRTLIRIGNESYTRQNNSFGLTTLRSRHVQVEGSSLRFAFIGKSGKEWRLKLVDRRIAAIVRNIQELPGQQLFQYLDESGEHRPIQSQDVNDFIREAMGPEFSSKDFRTWGGTNSAVKLFTAADLPDTKRDQKRVANSVLDQVAKLLRNTRATCRKCYVHPAVIAAWQDGRLQAEIEAIRRRFRRTLGGLDADESTVLRWLRSVER
jgi:DNA topoisomerase I